MVKRLYSFWLSEELREALQQLKARDGIAESEAIRRSIQEFVTRKGIKIRERKIRKGGTKKPRP